MWDACSESATAPTGGEVATHTEDHRHRCGPKPKRELGTRSCLSAMDHRMLCGTPRRLTLVTSGRDGSRSVSQAGPPTRRPAVALDKDGLLQAVVVASGRDVTRIPEGVRPHPERATGGPARFLVAATRTLCRRRRLIAPVQRRGLRSSGRGAGPSGARRSSCRVICRYARLAPWPVALSLSPGTNACCSSSRSAGFCPEWLRAVGPEAREHDECLSP